MDRRALAAVILASASGALAWIIYSSMRPRSRRVRISIPPYVERAMRVLIDSGFQAYVVGGAVRDLVMGYTPADYDIATDAHPESVMEMFRSAGYNVVPTGIEYGVVTVIDGEGNELEVATFRKEIYVEYKGRRPIVTSFSDSLEEDVYRRDFTINALAASVDGYVIDYVGGLRDIDLRLIRFVGDPDERIREDPLRMIRAIRFASKLGFSIEPSSLRAIERNTHYVTRVSRERIGQELVKAAGTGRFRLFIELIWRTGLHIYVAPFMEDMAKVTHDRRGHHYGESVLQHTLDVLSRCDDAGASWMVKVACFLHDVGKINTREVRDGKVTFFKHDVVGSDMAFTYLLGDLRLSFKESLYISKLIRWHMYPYGIKASHPVEVARKLLSRFKDLEFARDLALLAYCDSSSNMYLEAYRILADEDARREYLLGKKESEIKPLLRGGDIISIYNVEPSPYVGLIKTIAHYIQIEKKIEDKDKLIETLCGMKIICPGGGPSFKEKIERLYGDPLKARAKFEESAEEFLESLKS